MSWRRSARLKLTFLEKCVARGFLLHGSPVNVAVLLPHTANCLSVVAANLKAVYACNQPQSVLYKTLLPSRRRAEGASYVHVCRAAQFTAISDTQFISLYPVVPEYTVTFTRAEVRALLSDVRVGKTDKALRKHWDFLLTVAERYGELAGPFQLQSETHGIAHATAVASVGYILAQKECPRFTREVIIGGFFHDIGRRSDTEGVSHALESCRIAEVALRKYWKQLKARANILFAIRWHAHGGVTRSRLVGCIWDADRLAMLRLLRKVDLSLLSTPSARREAVVLNEILEDQFRKHAVTSDDSRTGRGRGSVVLD